jgi:hypothetical protein
MAKGSKQSEAAELQGYAKVVLGVNQNITSAILLGGQTKSPAQIVAVFTGAIQASTDLDAAKLSYQQKLAARDAAFAAADTTEEQLKSYVMGAYGKTNPVVTTFGFPVAKPTVRSVKVKADAITKAAATREARHTMGPKQKAEIHGVVTPAASGSAETTPVTAGPVVTGTVAK